MDFSYVAGFFDGEGSVSVRRGKSKKRVPLVRMCQKHQETIERIMLFLRDEGVESCSWEEKGRPGFWRLEVRKLRSVERFLRSVRPFVTRKASVVEDALGVIDQTAWREGSYVMPEETRKKLSEAQRSYAKSHPESWSRLWTPQARENWIKSRHRLRGRKQSEEERERRSESMKEHWRRKRAVLP